MTNPNITVSEPVLLKILTSAQLYPSTKGYFYYKAGLEYLIDAPRASGISMTEVTRHVARSYNVTSGSVERVMRYTAQRISPTCEFMRRCFPNYSNHVTSKTTLFALYSYYLEEVNK